eukprot:m.86886 g.86886  ORF g.86886 m.86886 type:complete len:508 (+) comp12818_c0_seq2:144-1667(+)
MAHRPKHKGGVDPLWRAQMLFRQRKFQLCADACSKLLAHNPYDKAAWYLKTRALTEDVRISEIELEEEGLAEVLLDDNQVAALPKPGTSFSRPLTDSRSSRGTRPVSKSGRLQSGYARPGTQGARPSTMEGAMRTARSATSRPVTSASGRFVRLGTASMLSGDDGLFIDVSKLDFQKYSRRPALARALCLYLLHVVNDTVKAAELAAQATQVAQFKDWWWKAILGYCYHRLGMLRDAEKQLKSSLKEQPTIFATMLLAKVYIRLDQPQNAVECYQQGLDQFPNETILLAALARVYEGVGNVSGSVSKYQQLLLSDSTNVEAIASLAADRFYNDQPEFSLILYRRLLQMGVQCAELYNNLGLACFQAQQYDLCMNCFERALGLAEDDTQSDVWYNLSHVALFLGNITLARQSLVLAVTCDPTNGEALNNLGVLEERLDNAGEARGRYMAAVNASEHIHEPHYNLALQAYSEGDLQAAFQESTKALALFESHIPSQEILRLIRSELEQL